MRISSSYASSFMKQFKLKDRNITTEKDTMKNEKENLLGKVTLQKATKSEFESLQKSLHKSGKLSDEEIKSLSNLSTNFSKDVYKTSADSKGKRDWIKELNLQIKDQESKGVSEKELNAYKKVVSKLASVTNNALTKTELKEMMFNFRKNQYFNNEETGFNNQVKSKYNAGYVKSEDLNRRLHILSFLKTKY